MSGLHPSSKTHSGGGGGTSNSELKREIQALKDAIPPGELVSNCCKSASESTYEMDVFCAFAIIVSVALVALFIYLLLSKNEFTNYINNYRVTYSFTGFDRIKLIIGLLIFLGAIGGCIFYYIDTPSRLAKEHKKKWPILKAHNKICKKFFTYSYGENDIVIAEKTDKTPIVFPENKAISKIKVKISSLQNTCAIFVRKTLEDGTVKTVILSDPVFSKIEGGYQCVYDVLFPSKKYSIELVTNDPESVVSYCVNDVPEDIKEYIDTYDYILGRKCESYTLVVDQDHTVVANVETYCE